MSAQQTEEGLSGNPEGSLPLEGKVSAEQTDEVFLQKPIIKKIPQSRLCSDGRASPL